MTTLKHKGDGTADNVTPTHYNSLLSFQSHTQSFQKRDTTYAECFGVDMVASETNITTELRIDSTLRLEGRLKN